MQPSSGCQQTNLYRPTTGGQLNVRAWARQVQSSNTVPSPSNHSYHPSARTAHRGAAQHPPAACGGPPPQSPLAAGTGASAAPSPAASCHPLMHTQRPGAQSRHQCQWKGGGSHVVINAISQCPDLVEQAVRPAFPSLALPPATATPSRPPPRSGHESGVCCSLLT